MDGRSRMSQHRLQRKLILTKTESPKTHEKTGRMTRKNEQEQEIKKTQLTPGFSQVFFP